MTRTDTFVAMFPDRARACRAGEELPVIGPSARRDAQTNMATAFGQANASADQDFRERIVRNALNIRDVHMDIAFDLSNAFANAIGAEFSATKTLTFVVHTDPA